MQQDTYTLPTVNSASTDQAALDAVEAWRYQPATLNGFPVAVYRNIELSFHLEDD